MDDLQKTITVVDAPCGAGKTEWAISYMNAHPQEAFIFVTPFLSEVERIKKSTTAAFYDPQHYQRTDLLGGVAGSKTKLADFNDLLAKGRNIVTTHTTFTNATQDTVSILQDNSYHLILDEAVDVLLPLNDLIDSPNYRVNQKNVKLMLDNNIIAVDEDCRVRWTGGPRPGRKFCVSDFRQSQEFRVENTHDLADFPCPPHSPAGCDGMRAGTV